MQLKTKKFHIYSCEVKCSCGGIQAQGLRGGEGGKGRGDYQDVLPHSEHYLPAGCSLG